MTLGHTSRLVISVFLIPGGTALTFIGASTDIALIVLAGVALIGAGLKVLTPFAQRGLDWIDDRS